MHFSKYLKAAFLNHWNLLAFLGSAAFALISGRPDVLLPMVLADSLGLKRFGSLTGLMWFPLCVGVAIGPWLTGKIFDLTGSYTLGFELSAGAALLGAIATLATLPREYEQRRELKSRAHA